jgi:two-component system, NarL family, sensor histidine kinase DegS
VSSNPWAKGLADGARRSLALQPFALVAISLAATALLHYGSPQLRLGPSPFDVVFTRHSVERILFVLPMVLAALAFGRRGGLVTIGFASALMLPRALWLSPNRADALLETAAAVTVGYLLLRLVEAQAREKTIRLEAVARLGVLHAVAHAAAESRNLEEILHRALDKVLEVLGLRTGLAYLAEPQGRDLVLRAYRCLSPAAAEGLKRLGSSGPWAEVGEDVRPSSVGELSHALPAWDREGLGSAVFVPVRSKGAVQGALALALGSRLLTGEERELLSAVGAELGVVVENARLHEDVARKLQVQRQLNEIAERIVSELELDRILPKVLHIAQELTGADAGEVVLCEGSGALEHYCCTPNVPERAVPGPTEEVLHYRAMQTRQPVLLEDYPSAPGALPWAVRLGLASAVAVPILSAERCFGTLCLFNLHPAKRFHESELAMLSGVGRQTGVAIENARLYQSMRFYVRQITRAQEDERRRIARELHDETIQLLVAISRGLEAFPGLSGELPDAARARLASLQDLLREAVKGTRRFVQDLRPPMLDHLGLVACVEGLASEFEENTSLPATVRVAGAPRRLPPELELALFRIAQEALTNARRHANPSKALLFLEFLPSLVRLTVSDDGRGFEAPERVEELLSRGKLGLVGMFERARTVGGTLAVRANESGGTAVIAEVPAPAGGDQG